MRMFGLVGLVAALLVVGLVAKRQMGTTATMPQASPASVGVQGPRIQQDIQRRLDQVLQPPRVPDEP